MKKLSFVLILIFTSWQTLLSQTATPPAAGDGSNGNPYQIATLENLYWISQNSTEWDKHYIQTANINASGTATWNPDGLSGFYGWVRIGNATTNFSGTYDGQGFTINGLYINRPSTDNIGLFGYSKNAVLKNIGLTNVDITGHDQVGSLTGYVSYSTITNCYSTGSVAGRYDVGGLVGVNQYPTPLKNSYSSCTASGSNQVGGLVGYAYNSSVLRCYASGNVNGFFAVGGLVGLNYSTITDCYATGSVTGTNDVGGLIGWNNSGTISNDFAVGGVSGSTKVGGLIGENSSGTITNSFYDTENTGRSDTGKGEPKTTTAMKTLSTFTAAGWDFEAEITNGTNDYWDMDLSGTFNDGYPFLSWQNGGDTALPVKLVTFTACCQDRSVILNWATENELDNLGFVLERSQENDHWQQIASYITHKTLVGQGISTNHVEYAFTDSHVVLGKKYFYRLSAVNIKGEISIYSTVSVTTDKVPELTVMDPAYPNPFNPSTSIGYRLSEDSRVEISVYDIRGRLVKELCNTRQQAGYYHVYWNGTDKNGTSMPSGTYIIRMRTDNRVQSRKVLFLK